MTMRAKKRSTYLNRKTTLGFSCEGELHQPTLTRQQAVAIEAEFRRLSKDERFEKLKRLKVMAVSGIKAIYLMAQSEDRAARNFVVTVFPWLGVEIEAIASGYESRHGRLY